MTGVAETLMGMYRAMRRRFGHQGWWPGDGPLEVCVGAILTQNTNWSNVEKAIAALRKADCLSLGRLHAKPQAAVARLIRSAGYFNVKAKRLKSFVAHVQRDFPDDIEGFLDRAVDSLREELLSINGIGPETADSMILYAAGKATFVVDAYTCRVLARHMLVGQRPDYGSVQALFESNLPRRVALWNDFHAQFVAVGRHYCRPRVRCEGCPLASFPHDASLA